MREKHHLPPEEVEAAGSTAKPLPSGGGGSYGTNWQRLGQRMDGSVWGTIKTLKQR